MPLTDKGQEIMSHMKKEYGAKEGESVFYASKNKGKISGVDSVEKLKKATEHVDSLHKRMDAVARRKDAQSPKEIEREEALFKKAREQAKREREEDKDKSPGSGERLNYSSAGRTSK